MLEFTCSSCGRRLQVADAGAGKKCRCGGCGQIVDAPRLASVTVPDQAAPAANAPAPALAPPPAAPRAKPERGRSAEDSLTDERTLPPGAAEPAPGTAALPAAIPAADDSEMYEFLGPPEGADEIGRLGGYRVLKVLGGGGMGVVFLAEDLRLKRRVALKTLLPMLAASAANRQRFHQEAQAAAAIEHDHIVTIYQVGEDRGIPFIAMQLLRGESLDERLRLAGRLDVAEVLRVGREIAAGLAVAHERGLIHRDIKPSNVWLETPADPGAGRAGRVKILDFGLARLVTGDSHLTRSGAILGTPAYMSPEQARGRPVDPRTDLFSLGCVLYVASTGRPPFRGSDVISTLMSVAEDDPSPPHRIDPEVPPRLSRLIMTLLAKDPARRPDSARAVIAALQEMEGGLDADRTEPGSLSVPPALARRAPSTANLDRRSDPDGRTMVQADEPAAGHGKTWLLAAAIAGLAGGFVLLLVLGLVAFLLWGRSKPPESLSTEPAAANAPKPDGPPTLDPEVQKLLAAAVKQNGYTKTSMVGFPLSPEFTEVPPEGALLIGFEFGLGKFGANDVIHSVRPIYLGEKGEFFGQQRGKPTDRLQIVKAKRGYAVGTLRINAHLLIDGVQITFMKLDGKYLDPDQSYTEQVATLGGNKHNEGILLGPGGSLVLGICGRDDGRGACNALGLVFRGKAEK